MTTTTLFWNPHAGIRRSGDWCFVAGCGFPATSAPLIERIADLTAKGGSPDDLATNDPGEHRCTTMLVQALTDLGALVTAPASMHEVAHGQSTTFADALLCNEDLADTNITSAFRARQATRRPNGNGSFQLPDAPLPGWLAARRSDRVFTPDDITLEELGKMMACLRHRPAEDNPFGRRAWPSAGGLYAIDCYLHIKPGRIESLTPGIHAYDPISNHLVAEPTAGPWDETLHFLTNRDVHRSSAMSVILVADLAAIVPKYHDMGYPLALIDAGVVTATLSLVASDIGLGSCCIGDLDFERAHDVLNLDPRQQVVHTIEIGHINRRG